MRKTRLRWKQYEEDYLIENYKKKSLKSVMSYLGRSENSILKKASRLGIHKLYWTKKEDDYLIRHYKTKTANNLAKEIGRTYDSIAQRLSTLKLKKTSAELSELMKNIDGKYKKGKEHYRWNGGKPKGTCKYCNKEFEGEFGNPNKYCSVSCSANANKRVGKENSFWNGGEKNWKRKKYLYQSTQWRALRIIIIKEEKECQICGGDQDLMVHHKKRYKLGGTNERKNLITFCSSCHHKYHCLEIFYQRNHAPKSFEFLLNELRRKLL